MSIPSTLVLVLAVLVLAALFVFTLEALKVSIWEHLPEEDWHAIVDRLPGQALPTLEEEAIEASLRKFKADVEAMHARIEWQHLLQEAIEATTPPAPAPTTPAPLEVSPISLRNRLFGRPEPVYTV